MMRLGVTGRDVELHIDLLPPLASLHISIIRPHVVWGTLIGNIFLQIMNVLSLISQSIYSSLFEMIPNKNLVTGFPPYPLDRKKRVSVLY